MTIIGNNTKEIINELFSSLLTRYPIGLEISMIGSDFVFDNIGKMYYKCHRICLNHGGLCINSPEWIKNQNVTINLKNNDDKCF